MIPRPVELGRFAAVLDHLAAPRGTRDPCGPRRVALAFPPRGEAPGVGRAGRVVAKALACLEKHAQKDGGIYSEWLGPDRRALARTAKNPPRGVAQRQRLAR